ncbi:hypothetical protein EDB83DRAFT_2464820, partial [Lactarius deliciosus]
MRCRLDLCGTFPAHVCPLLFPLLLILAVLTAQTCILYSTPRPSVLTLTLQIPQFVLPSDNPLVNLPTMALPTVAVSPNRRSFPENPSTVSLRFKASTVCFLDPFLLLGYMSETQTSR